MAGGGGQSDSDEDKTEEASSQRLEDYRKEGQVAQSKELTSLFVLVSTMAVMWGMGPQLASDFMDFMRKMFMEMSYTELTQERAGTILMLCLAEAGRVIVPIAAVGFLAGIVGSVAQFGFNFTWAPLEPKGDRINPIAGFGRVFALSSLVEGAKSLAKLTVVIWITYKLMAREMEDSVATIDMDGAQLVAYMSSHGFKLMFSVCIGLFVVAAADFAYQKFKYRKSLMMTKAEVKQEHKQKEGDPLLKARIRSIQREMSRKRMMQDVPKADVIVTNPTHFAVALKYDADKMAAPRVIAKGADLVAQRIKEVARKHNIPLVENVPLARALHKNVKVGGSVPKNLYQAVAEVLAYVYRLKGRFS
jgi:flagellar biosynthetic protein FlhB